MATIPQESIDRMMVKCARRCCVCRRYRPTKLQVHHIVEQSDGGTHDEDNLIVICLPCHTDVHSHVPFTRRFTIAELKGHRDTLMRSVEEGRFPLEDDNTAEVDNRVIVGVSARRIDVGLSAAAVELLLAAAHANGHSQGTIMVVESLDGTDIIPGSRESICVSSDRRAVALYKAAIRELEACDFVEQESECTLSVTHLGYLAADEIVAQHGRA